MAERRRNDRALRKFESHDRQQPALQANEGGGLMHRIYAEIDLGAGEDRGPLRRMPKEVSRSPCASQARLAPASVARVRLHDKHQSRCALDFLVLIEPTRLVLPALVGGNRPVLQMWGAGRGAGGEAVATSDTQVRVPQRVSASTFNKFRYHGRYLSVALSFLRLRTSSRQLRGWWCDCGHRSASVQIRTNDNGSSALPNGP